jgi:hypothetical protein
MTNIDIFSLLASAIVAVTVDRGTTIIVNMLPITIKQDKTNKVFTYNLYKLFRFIFKYVVIFAIILISLFVDVPFNKWYVAWLVLLGCVTAVTICRDSIMSTLLGSLDSGLLQNTD